MKQDRQMALAHEILKPINPSASILVHLYIFFWGLWLSLPWIETFGRSAIFNLLEHLAPEWVYGVAAMAIGIVSIYGIFKKNLSCLKIGNLAAFMFYMTISIMFLVGDWRSTAFITSFLVAMYCGFLYLNMKKNQEHYLSEYDPRYKL